ncbi:MAG TPA: amidohydrolase, partial [Vicinamibacteria bacterium]|nr:amidohydrolase [Vicinamibacteria bacterium]
MILCLLAAADLLVVNGRIHTLDPSHPEATAVLVRGERIVAVGGDSEVRRQAGPSPRVVDLGGRALIPGLIDTHTHLFDAVASRVAGDLDVGVPAVKSLAEAVAAVRERAAAAPAGKWIVGDGWGESKWPERRYVRKADLDPVSAGHPVYLVHVSGHAGTLNSEGLRLSGITRATAAPQGGEIEHGPDGDPTGVLKDTAMGLAKVEIAPFGPEEKLATAERAGRESAAVGLTTIHNSSLPLEDAETYRKADAQGRLRVRVLAIPFIPNQGTDEVLARLRTLGAKTGDRKGRVTWGAVKFMCDGGMAAKTIAVTGSGPVDDPKNLGLLGWETAKLTAAMKAVHEMGWQITAHAIGDRAIGQVLDALEAALGPKPGDHRSRIVHCGVTTPALLDRIKKMGVLVDHNPPFPYWIGDWFRNYGPERVAMSYRGKSYEESGIVVSGGSDVSVTPLSPWWGIWSAVERKEYRTGEVLAPSERVDVKTALKWYTMGGAFAGFEEKDKGMLAAGRLADFIVLDRDPLTVPSAELKDVK